MADVPTLNFRSLQKYLGQFEQKLKRVLEACDIEFHCNLRPEKIPNSNRFKLPKFAKFVGVKQRGNSKKGKQKLSIFFHFEGELDNKECVTKHRIRVCYALVKNPAQPNKICLVRGTHYDFNSNSEPLHPICHAQEDITTLKDEISENNYDIQNAEQIDNFRKNCLFVIKSSRIPTTFFDLFSVIIMVLADHCVKKDVSEQVSEFNKILKFVIEKPPNTSLVPKHLFPNKSTLRNTKIENLHSAHWYCS